MGVRWCFVSTTAFTFNSLKLSAAPTPHFAAGILSKGPILVPSNLALLFPLPPAAPRAVSSAASDVVIEEKGQWKAAIDFKWMRDNRDAVAANIRNRNFSANLDLVLRIYAKTLDLHKEVECLRKERNAVASKMKGKLEQSERQRLIEEGKNIKDNLTVLEENLLKLTVELRQEAQCIPNMTHPDTPIGDEDHSAVRKTIGSPREFTFPVKDHLQICEDHKFVDFEAAAKVSGSKFYYLRKEAAALERALVNWTLSEVIKRGFTELTTPQIVRSSAVEKCGFQPRGANTQVYSIERSNQCLIGTAEIPLGGIHMDSILADSELPRKYVACSDCFRTEAGAAGTSSKGLFRVHQFKKVEMFILCRPEESETYHEELINIEEDLFSLLGLHFKYGFLPLSSDSLDMASGDLGAPAYRKFDIEAWMPGLGRYGEISSASNCTDYQSRRLGIRYRPSELPSASTQKGKGSSAATQFIHTLNATACAVPRMMICILENFQQENGSVIVPEPLKPYMGGIERIGPKPR